MANMSNNYILLSRGYANVKTQFGFVYSTYAEVWGCACSDIANLKVRISAPKGYKVDSITVAADSDTYTIGKSFIEVFACITRSWGLDAAVQRICDKITINVQRIVDQPLGIVVTNSRLGVVHASCGGFVSYADCIEAYNFAMEVAEKGDIVAVILSTEDEAEEALACIDGDEHYIFYSSAELCWGVK